MKSASFCLLLIFTVFTSPAQVEFNKYFNGQVLRFDFMFAGNGIETKLFPVAMKQEPFWAGSPDNLIDPFGYGNFRYEVTSLADNRLIFSRGFSSLFQEWQTTSEAKTTEKCFYEVVKMPFPKSRVLLQISIRERKGQFSNLFETIIDPEDYYIRQEKPADAAFTKIYGSWDPRHSVDFAFIAEGYRSDEMEKFRTDVRHMADALFAEPPFSEYRDKINIWAVEAISSESGTDIPGEKIYRNTVLNSSFYTFGTDRYITTQDIKSVNDFAAVVPHDNIIVLINSDRYGGGGVYNYYSGATAGHQLSPKVLIHELGHGFAGLADEYHSSSVAYDEFYPLDVEPWEPNITTLVDFSSKWKDLIQAGVPVPTPPYPEYEDITGLFEGAGYSAKGIYRPEADCRMKSNGEKGYCKVCREAIRKMIDFYTK
jgi:hypothetical protein